MMKLMLTVRKVRKLGIFCLVGIAIGVMAYAASAAELPAGTVINKANLDKVMNDTFEGETIRSMLIASQEYQIRNWALQMKLRHSKLPVLPPSFVEATEKYAKDVKFNPKTREVSGWKAGLPFPEASPVTSSPAAVAEFMKDPYAGDKVIWNYYYAHQGGRTQYCPHSWLLVSADTGLERRQDWFWLRYYMKGRLDGPGMPPVLGDGSIISKTLFFVTAPYDMRGIGIFALRYDSSKLEDNWVYVKSVRRTRRLSGGAWVDPVDGLDMLGDEIWIINARPSWYKSFKLLRKRWVLVIANAQVDWVEGAKTPAEEFPAIDLKNWPHWNFAVVPGNEWEPREVWEVEGIPPSYHPHSRRVLYADVHAPPTIYIGESYDKEGKLWKYVQYSIGTNNAETARAAGVTAKGTKRVIPPSPTEEACNGITPAAVYIDFKRRHSSHHYDRIWDSNPKIGPNDVTLGQLEAAGK